MNLTTQKLVKEALLEDMPAGDITTDNLSLDEVFGRAKLIAKEDLVLSGIEIFSAVMRELDPAVHLTWHFKNGDFIFKGQTLLSLQGNLKQILKAERVALNFLGHLSGIASFTRCFVEEVKSTPAKILDTRKTTPGLRLLEKEAVRDGGGQNHRMNLSDAVLIKENHIRFAGGIKKAIASIRKATKIKIAIEVRNLAEVEEALAANADRLLLDNMSNEEMAEALKRIPAKTETEATGNMTLERVGSVARLGVNFISIGALTHSAPCADISLLFE